MKQMVADLIFDTMVQSTEIINPSMKHSISFWHWAGDKERYNILQTFWNTYLKKRLCDAFLFLIYIFLAKVLVLAPTANIIQLISNHN